MSNNSPVSSIQFFDLDNLVEVGYEDFKIAFAPTCANDVISEAISNSAVPEPATMLLLGSGLFGVAYSRRRKSKEA